MRQQCDSFKTREVFHRPQIFQKAMSITDFLDNFLNKRRKLK